MDSQHPAEKRQKLELAHDSRDFTLKVGEEKIRANKKVLEENSNYFQHKFLYLPDDCVSLEMNTDAACLKKCVAHMHGEEVIFGECDLSLLLDVAHNLEITGMCEDIFKYLQRTLSIPSFVCTKKLAEKHNNSELMQKCETFATMNFEELAASEVFSFLDFNGILSILQSDNIKVSSWIRVYEAILRWTKVDITNRHHLFAKLFRHINLVNIPLAYKAESMENEMMIKQSEACLERVYRSYKDAHENSEGIILLDSSCVELKAYHPYSERWYSIPTVKRDISTFGATIVATTDHLYILMTDGTAYRRIYTQPDALWEKISSMNNCLQHNDPAVDVSGLIYAFGNDFTERYDPCQNVWTSLANRKTSKGKFCITAVKECIFCIGGFDGFRKLATVEMFDTIAMTWCDIAPMKTPKMNASAVTLHNTVYVVDTQENIVEHYDLFIWTIFRTHHIAHNSIRGACVVNGEIFTVSSWNNSNTIRKLDLVTKKWEEVKQLPNQSWYQFRCIAVTERRDFDFTIKVDSREIKAHRRILSGKSDYFKAMFSHDMKESISGVVDMKEVDFQSLNECITFIYGDGLPDFSRISLHELLHVATLLQLQEMVDQTCIYLESQLCEATFADIKNLANFYNCDGLDKKCDDFFLQKFEKVIFTDKFPLLEKDYLEYIITSKSLNVTSKIIVYEAVLRWTRFDSASRSKSFEELFSHLNLVEIPERYVSEVIQNEFLVKSSKKCSLRVLQSFRKRHREHEAIVAVDMELWKLRAYNTKTDSWSQLQTIPEYMRESTEELIGISLILQLEGHIYVITEECALYRLNCNDMKWSWMADMTECENCEVSGVVLDGCIYAFGDDAGEKYNPRRNNWIQVTHSPSRSEYAIVAFKESIYFIGGEDEDEAEDSSNKVDIYDPITKNWEYDISRMNTPRRAAAAASFQERIYVLGGWKDFGFNLNSVEVYDPEQKMWTMIADMKISRVDFRAFVIDGELIALGGDESWEAFSTLKWGFARTMESFNPIKKDWEVKTLSGLYLVSKTAVAVKLKYKYLIQDFRTF